MNARPSMILGTGGIQIRIPVDEMTWFHFLTHSRNLNSGLGGWNSKSFWRDDGLTSLTKEPFHEHLRQWTDNSLKPKAKPKPREGGFQFARELSGRRKDLDPITKRNLHTASENALNFDIFANSNHKKFGRDRTWTETFPLHEIHFLGYEIPLGKESEGQLKADLFWHLGSQFEYCGIEASPQHRRRPPHGIC